ncbi:tRNA pseudouridine(38-40) synthase TruA [bacterium]|nr:tRNA pseudouridine(38-40) synthase TruA [bacterium]
MRTIRLTLAYDGTRYSGWQVQPDRLSLQQVVETAVSDLSGEPVKVAASGRTDAGVHAVGQVVSFHTSSSVPVDGYRWGLVTRLPDDIVVTDAVEMPYGFHARFDALRKRYRYVIYNSRTANPWLRNAVWWLRAPLDVTAMQAAAETLVGTHDFRCFETNWPNRSSSVRTIFAAKWSRCELWSPWNAAQSSTASPALSPQPSTIHPQPFLYFDITADGFLYNMVRAIVGSLIHVGRGKWTSDDLRRILESGTRSDAGDNAPACGLYLMDVETVVDAERIAKRLAKTQIPEDDSNDD